VVALSVGPSERRGRGARPRKQLRRTHPGDGRRRL